MADVKLFLSCVSDEFGDWRESLRHELTSLMLDVAIQEDFGALGVDTLSKLDAYIRNCDAVIHLAGAKAGAAPNDFVARRSRRAACGSREAASAAVRGDKRGHSDRLLAMGGVARAVLRQAASDCTTGPEAA